MAEALPGVIVAGDSTQPVYGANLFYEPAGPSSWFNSSTGYGTLGYGLPAAMGAKLACPDRPVVALIGDGGIQFTIGELATAVELGLALPILLWNNRGYGEIKQYMLDRGIPRSASTSTPPTSRPSHAASAAAPSRPRVPRICARSCARPMPPGADRHRDRRRGGTGMVGRRAMTSRSLTERAAGAFIDGAWRTARGPLIDAVEEIAAVEEGIREAVREGSSLRAARERFRYHQLQTREAH